MITRDDRYIITADRDEKIRVSKFPNSYNIKTFCLGHTEYVNDTSILNSTLESINNVTKLPKIVSKKEEMSDSDCFLLKICLEDYPVEQLVK